MCETVLSLHSPQAKLCLVSDWFLFVSKKKLTDRLFYLTDKKEVTQESVTGANKEETKKTGEI